MTYKSFIKTVNEIWKIRNSCNCFDFPDYGGLQKQLTRTYSSEVVDAIQNTWSELKLCKNKNKYKSIIKLELFRLGEQIKQ